MSGSECRIILFLYYIFKTCNLSELRQFLGPPSIEVLQMNVPSLVLTPLSNTRQPKDRHVHPTKGSIHANASVCAWRHLFISNCTPHSTNRDGGRRFHSCSNYGGISSKPGSAAVASHLVLLDMSPSTHTPTSGMPSPSTHCPEATSI